MWYSNLIESMNIFQKYNQQGVLKAEHGIILTHVLTTEISEQDRDRLIELGWHTDHGYFALFV